jgi:hypothetical protein
MNRNHDCVGETNRNAMGGHTRNSTGSMLVADFGLGVVLLPLGYLVALLNLYY